MLDSPVRSAVRSAILPAVAGSAPAFSMLELSPVLWLDATVPSSVLNSSDAPATTGQPVKAWLDQSGNNHHVYQNLDANDRPLLTANGVSFDGADDYLSTYNTAHAALGAFTANTVFIVCRVNTAATSKYLSDLRGSGVRGSPNLHYSAPTLSLCGQGQLPKVGITVGDWFVACIRHADNFRAVTVNAGVESQNATAATLLPVTTSGYAIGGSGAIPATACTHMDVREFVLVPSNITDSALRAKAISRLMSKHGIA